EDHGERQPDAEGPGREHDEPGEPDGVGHGRRHPYPARARRRWTGRRLVLVAQQLVETANWRVGAAVGHDATGPAVSSARSLRRAAWASVRIWSSMTCVA